MSVSNQETLQIQSCQRHGVRSWFRFSLRSLLIIATLICILTAIWVLPSERQRRLANQVEAMKGRIYFSNETAGWPEARYDYQYTSPEQSFSPWYYHYFYSVERVWAGRNQPEGTNWALFPRLKHLILERYPERSFSFSELKESRSLISLKLLGFIPTVTDVDPSCLPQLESLAFNSRIDVEVLKAITKFKTLKSLCIECQQFPDNGMSIIATLPLLESFDIYGKGTSEGATTVVGFDQLRKINLKLLEIRALLSDDDVAGVGTLLTLEKLHLKSDDHSHISQRSIENLSKLTQLKELVCHQGGIDQVAEIDPLPLQTLTNLEVLDLNDRPWPASILVVISKYTKLKTLAVNSKAFSAEQLKSLSGLQQLEVINLGYADVDEAGVRTLLGLKKLKSITVFGTKLSDQTVQEFKRQGVTINQVQSAGSGSIF